MIATPFHSPVRVKRRLTPPKLPIALRMTSIGAPSSCATAIAAVLRAARESTAGQVIAVVQPHRYTRLSSLFEGFCTCCNDADSVIVADVYPAGEAPIEGVDKTALANAIAAHGHRQAMVLPSPDKLAGLVRSLATPGDYVVFLGAGTITQWAYALPAELAASDAA